ncbi:leucine rich repeat domain protein [Moniliophthora roreri MCA 2997]|uniref:Leucine rich repeat domain protein n=2 Tax=Moniliophthora roreri TaxID=221103 RepID=V2XUI5_MONRO|nr:leucine rich repeat domain protein [Moniliophthora roreri MCA 2997]KAI3612516.1 leucine rich repeat domain protein [Moniliophthora roreri]
MSFLYYDSPPPSSPASSPSPYVDSSPPSSPGTYLGDEVSQSPGPQDPYAASAKAVRQPRLYEKKRQRSISPTPDLHNKKSRPVRSSSPSPDLEWNDIPRQRDEAQVWNDAATRVFDLCHGKVDLEAQGLTHIPTSFIADLNKFWVTPGTEPAPSSSQPQYNDDGSSHRRTFSRTRSLAAEYSGFPRDKIQLLLAINDISVLPQEFFTLSNLTVLSLRGNKLTYIPPEINQLTALENLNISSNRLTFLPSEIMDLTLSQLQLYPNPFLSPPINTDRPAKTLSRSLTSRSRLKNPQRKPFSSTIAIFDRVIPLSELCLRRLLAPSLLNSQHSVLEDTYELPLSEDGGPPLMPSTKRRFTQRLPSLIHDVLDTAIPGSVYVDSLENTPSSSQGSHLFGSSSQSLLTDFDAWLKQRKEALMRPNTEYHHITWKSFCSSPRHVAHSVFVVHAEERFTWEHTIAGVPNLGEVPIRWRGCQKGCLDHLDGSQKQAEDQQLDQSSQGAVPPKTAEGASEGAVDVVQTVQFTSGSFTLEDFDD